MKTKEYECTRSFVYGTLKLKQGDLIELTQVEAAQLMQRRKPLIKNITRYNTKDIRPAQDKFSIVHRGAGYYNVKRNGEVAVEVQEKGREAAEQALNQLVKDA